MAPGVADALNAKLVQRHGFEAIYMTGAGTTAVRLGMPDVGLLTMTEMVDNAARIADSSGLSLDNVSTAADLVQLGELALETPALAEIVATQSVDIPELGTPARAACR